MLEAHPGLRTLIGHNPWTSAIALALVAAQIVASTAFGRLGLAYWPAAALAAWSFGAFVNHALYVVIHDAAHDLIFRRRAWNKAVAIIADLPNIVPGAIGFCSFHLKHHAFLSQTGRDPDVPFDWEVELVGASSVKKALWLALFPFVQAARAVGLGGLRLNDPWILANLVANAVFAWFETAAFGPGALVYLLFSFWFSIGPHPLGAR